MSTEIQYLLRDLEFISYIDPGQTINVGTKVLVCRGSFWSWITRTPTGEAVGRTVGWVQERVTKAIDWIEGGIHMDSHVELLNALINCINGIESLIVTYNADEWNKASLVTLIRIIIKVIKQSDQKTINKDTLIKIEKLSQKYDKSKKIENIPKEPDNI